MRVGFRPRLLELAPWLCTVGKVIGLSALALLGSSLVCSGAVNQWTNSASGPWEGLNWSLGVLPDSTQSVKISNSGGKTVLITPITALGFPASLTVNDLSIGADSGTNILRLSLAGTNVPLTILNDLTIYSGGAVVNLSSGVIVQGLPAVMTNAVFIQDGGLVRMAAYIGGGSVYYLTNGQFEGEISLGRNTGHGAFNQYGGSIDVDRAQIGGEVAGAGTGTYNLDGGTFTAENFLFVGGTYNTGIFHQRGGTAACGSLYLYAGNYILDAGSIDVEAIVLDPTDAGAATFEQNGGTNEVLGLTIEGNIAGGQGGSNYRLRDGTLRAWLITLGGFTGHGLYAQTNGTASVGSQLRFESFQSIADFVLHGGTLACDEVASFASSANITQTGGALIVSNLFAYHFDPAWGAAGHPTYNFSGGTFFAHDIDLSTEWIIGSSSQTGRISNPGYIKLAGRLRVGDAREQLGRFILGTNLVIDLGLGAAKLTFADSSAELWTEGAFLWVTNWNGSPAGGGTDQLKFGSAASALTTSQLEQIRFLNPGGLVSGTYAAQILATGEVVPRPRPEMFFSLSGKKLVLNWTGNFVLQASTNIAGPYFDLTGVPAPFTNDLPAFPQRFFRLRQ
jgi:hypothetical protein